MMVDANLEPSTARQRSDGRMVGWSGLGYLAQIIAKADNCKCKLIG